MAYLSADLCICTLFIGTTARLDARSSSEATALKVNRNCIRSNLLGTVIPITPLSLARTRKLPNLSSRRLTSPVSNVGMLSKKLLACNKFLSSLTICNPSSNRIYKLHDESKDKDFTLEMTWACDESKRRHQLIPQDLLEEAVKSAKDLKAKEEQDSDDDDDDDDDAPPAKK